MTQTIYQDEKVTLTTEGSVLTATLADGRKTSMSLKMIRTGSLGSTEQAMVRKVGKDPEGMFGVYQGSACQAALPEASRQSIDQAIAGRAAEIAAAKADPCNVERGRVTDLFSRADRKCDYPGEYFPALQEAKDAKAAWAAKYPQAAAAENARNAEFEASEKARREEEYRTSFIGRGLD